jgi:biotin carboxyl carrier protein
VKYFARVGEREYEVEVEQGRVTVNGKAVEVDLTAVGIPELYSILFGGRSFDFLVHEQYVVQVENERSRRLNSGRLAPALPQGELPIKAPISGLVVKVLVEPGDIVEDGQPLVILEAMKMENEIRSLRAGVVKSVAVTSSTRVEQHAVLLILE